jgi:DNA invertase Pin-like site-specific DNA recombinase
VRGRPRQHPVPAKLLEPVTRAAAYVRMSTEHQKYSTYNQMTAIEEYAAQRKFVLCRVYEDEGLSGLQIKNRPGLRGLISDVLKGTADFTAVLVYDVTRWGRFQDLDYSAYYEVLCRMSGVEVVYCAEVFQNDHSSLSTILKTIRRAEAADFSRDLSAKVFNGMCNIARRGYAPGGPAPYGLKTIMVRDDGKPMGSMARRRKRLTGCHIELAPGPKNEVRVVREIFRRYVKLGETTGQIAAHLNSGGQKTRFGCQWRSYYIGDMLLEEKYVGTAIYNRTSRRLQSRQKNNEPSAWITKPNAFPAIVDPIVFRQAEERRREELRYPTDEEILMRLRRFVARREYVTQKAFHKSGNCNLHYEILRRFGSIVNACDLIGHKWTSRDLRRSSRVRNSRIRVRVLAKIGRALEPLGLEMRTTILNSFWIEEHPCYIEIVPTNPRHKKPKWLNHSKYRREYAVQLLCRLAKDGDSILDYIVIPRADVPGFPVVLNASNPAHIDALRVDDVAEVAQRVRASLPKEGRRYGLMLPQIAR